MRCTLCLIIPDLESDNTDIYYPTSEEAWKYLVPELCQGLHNVLVSLRFFWSPLVTTAVGPSIPSSQDSILLSPGLGRCVGGEGKLTTPYSSLGRLGHMTPWTNNWHREGNFHEGLRPGEIHIQPGLCEGGTGTGAHSQPAGPAVQSCSGNGHSSVEQQGEKV